jgi:predicted RNase H-like HicB family nuclease
MQTFTAIVEKCSETGLYVGYVPGFPGAHSQGQTLDELNQNLQEVVSLLLDDGEPHLECPVRGHSASGSCLTNEQSVHAALIEK